MIELRTGLLPHQEPAVEKQRRLKAGALLMDMGTGKSRTAIELAHRRFTANRISRVIWYCPVTLKETIRQEILKHTTSSDSQICVFEDKTDDRNVPRSLWYVIGIESMSASDRVVFAASKITTARTMVICDESSYIKGHSAKRTRRITEISRVALYRIILTGTPMTQGVVDLYAQFRFLDPRILGYRSFYSFASNHLEYHPDRPDFIVRSHNVDYLAARVRPYVYQITKDECLDLPSKLYSTRYAWLTREQEEAYELAKDEILIDQDIEFGSEVIFRLFTALQQIVCGFWNRRVGQWWRRSWDEKPVVERLVFQHNRLKAMLDTVLSIREEEKVVIFTKNRYFDIDGITATLREHLGEESTAEFHGGIGHGRRNREIERFKSEARFLVATTSCGSHGLNLTNASHVIFYTNGFKYSDRIQAEDRIHRIGQDGIDRDGRRAVVYTDIQTNTGIENRIAAALSNKGGAVESFRREIEAVKNDPVRRKDLIRGL